MNVPSGNQSKRTQRLNAFERAGTAAPRPAPAHRGFAKKRKLQAGLRACDVSQWPSGSTFPCRSTVATDDPTIAYRCGGSAGLVLADAPASRFTSRAWRETPETALADHEALQASTDPRRLTAPPSLRSLPPFEVLRRWPELRGNVEIFGCATAAPATVNSLSLHAPLPIRAGRRRDTRGL